MSDDNQTTQPPDADKGTPQSGLGRVDATAPRPQLGPDYSPGEPTSGFGRGIPPPDATGLGEPQK